MIRALTDERLAGLAQAGDRDATDELMRRYERAATGIASNYFLPGGTVDDARQEARVGLLKAIRTYQTDRGATFASFARLAMTAEVVTALVAATRLKHRMLNETIRHTEVDGETIPAYDLIPAQHDTHELVESAARLAAVVEGMQTLSPLERRWLVYAINGGEYSADVDGRRNKSAENAVDRARLKLRRTLQDAA